MFKLSFNNKWWFTDYVLVKYISDAKLITKGSK